ncbi:MAG TPA: PPOX class F420-dependent oxidoreductase [Candidatus Xenobia bacterium]|jgi:hypothetical protein
MNWDDHRFVSLTTFKKSGEAVATPMWFVVISGKVCIYTSGASWKVRRLRNNPRATLAPCTAGAKLLGDACDVTARFLGGVEAEAVRVALRQRYGLQKAAVDVFSRLKGTVPAYIEFSPGGLSR